MSLRTFVGANGLPVIYENYKHEDFMKGNRSVLMKLGLFDRSIGFDEDQKMMIVVTPNSKACILPENWMIT